MSLGMKALSGVMAAYTDRDNEALRRTEAKRLQQQSQQQIDVAPAKAELELAQVKQQTYQTNSSLLAQQTYDAFDRYESDGDARHLNAFLERARSNPVGQSLYADYTRIEALGTVRSPEVTRQLQSMGIQDVEGFYSDPNLTKQYVLATRTDGSQELMDMNKVYGVTGYTRYQSNQQLEEATKRAQLNRLLMTGESLNSVQQREQLIASLRAEDPNLSYAQAFERAKEIEKGQQGSIDVQGIQNIMAENPNLSYAEAATKWFETKRAGVGAAASKTDQQRFIDNYMQENPGSTYSQASNAYANRVQTSTQKEIGTVDTVKAKLDELNFGSEEEPIGFFDKDMSNLTSSERAKVHKYIADIEDLRNVKLSTDDKRLARDLRNLRELGSTAGEQLTDAETGLIDRTLNTFKSYVINEVGGKEATSAYETFRNIFRNSLYGASLTKSEIAAFDKAAGTLGQKTKPVLTALRTQIQTIKTQLEAIRDTNDPYIAHFYFGSDIEAVDEVIRALDDRLGLLTSTEARAQEGPLTVRQAQEAAAATAPPPGERVPLDQIFKGAQ
jgi:hypothetical protein